MVMPSKRGHMATMQVTERHSWVDQSSSRWFYAAVAFTCILISFVSFMPSLANPSHRLGSPTWLTTLHGMVFCLWLLIFLAQTLLVQTRRIACIGPSEPLPCFLRAQWW
jgi:protein-S-isoprenylcysteine O-methyltransferase Ste14